MKKQYLLILMVTLTAIFGSSCSTSTNYGGGYSSKGGIPGGSGQQVAQSRVDVNLLNFNILSSASPYCAPPAFGVGVHGGFRGGFFPRRGIMPHPGFGRPHGFCPPPRFPRETQVIHGVAFNDQYPAGYRIGPP
jgi:hypothetical protein